MTFAPEKRLLLGWLALVAPLPLPFNEVLEWPVLFLYLLALIHFLGRAEDPTRGWLDNRALNGLGLIYLPVLAFDAWQGAQRNQMVITLLHLILFVLVAKLYSVRQEKDKWHVLLAIFFVFVASMATSSNIAIALYLLVVLGLGLLSLGRLSELHMRAALGESGAGRTAAGQPGGRPAAPAGRRGGMPRPRRGALLAVLAVALLAAPIFAALPRLAQPFLTGRGAGNLGMSRVSGFSDEVSLDFSGRIRTSRLIAMRLLVEQPIARPEEMRFKGAAYDIYKNRRWLRDNDLFDELRPADGHFRVAESPAAAEAAFATVYLEPMDSGSVLVPSETVSLSFPAGGPKALYLDGGGGLILPFSARQRRETLEYRVALAREPQVRGLLERPATIKDGGGPAALDTSAVTPRMAELARRVMGEGSAEQKILRLESHLLAEYAYTLDISDEGGDPIEDFLFVKKAGHCEYFATAMVLLLRAEGIPARFATGFLGAESNAIEDLLVVRQSNAHAWVEAYSPERGWQVYDPTPPAGRPGAVQVGMGLLVRQLYEYIAFRWDRYVLTYGADDQGSLRERLQKYVAAVLARFRSWLGAAETPPPAPTASGPAAPATEDAATAAAASTGGLEALSAGLVAALLLAGGFLLWRRRPRSATFAYLALRRPLEAAEVGISPATPPLEVRAALRRLAPEQAAAADRLIALYLDEAFGGRPLAAAETAELPALRATLEKALRRRLAELRARRPAGAARLAEQVET